MAEEREVRGTAEAKETKGMGSGVGVIVGVIVGIGLFMLTVQFLHMAK